MKFLKSQSAVESVRNAPPKPRSGGGKKMKQFHFETDLVFIRKPDFVKISPKFEDTIKKHETYIISTCEVLTGICRLNYIQKKSDTMPFLIKHLKSIAKELGIKDLSKYSGSSDKGEVIMKDIQKIMPWKFVKMGSSVEKSNQTIQKTLFKLARMRRGYNIQNLLKQTQDINNNKFNSVHKKSPNELAIEAQDEKEQTIVQRYNKKRRKHISNVKTQFKVGDFVRILLLTHGKDRGLDFKSYKGKTFSNRSYKITKATKNAVPAKYWVNRRWYLADTLLRSEKVDEISEKIVADREEAQMAKDELQKQQDFRKRKQELAKEIARKKKQEEEEIRKAQLSDVPPRRRSRRAGALKGIAKRLKSDITGHRQDMSFLMPKRR
jgi:hypothetical protein